eukprot:582605-Amphidinium_carterae.1
MVASLHPRCGGHRTLQHAPQPGLRVWVLTDAATSGGKRNRHELDYHSVYALWSMKFNCSKQPSVVNHMMTDNPKRNTVH